MLEKFGFASMIHLNEAFSQNNLILNRYFLVNAYVYRPFVRRYCIFLILPELKGVLVRSLCKKHNFI